MQVSIKTTSGLERRMTIVVPSETFEQQVTDRLTATARRARIAGFRPGKVPLKEVRRRFGAAVRQEVAGELMQQSFVDAIRQESLSPAGQPSLEVISMNPGSDLEFAATFEVFPHIDLAPFSTLSVKRPHAVVADEDVDRMVGTLREQRRTFRDVERPSVDGDRVTIDFTGFRDGAPFEGGSGQGVAFVLGQKQMIEDFETGVRGQAPGAEVSFEARFPDDYRVETLRGQTVRFDVKVKGVAEPQLPELDEAFFKAFGIEEGGLEAFRREVRANMERELDAAVRNQVKRQVMDELNRVHTVQLPAGMVAREIGELRHQMAHQMGMHGHDHDHDHDHGKDMPDLPDDFFRAEAERRVKIGLVVNQIITSRNVTTDAGRVRARIEEMARPYAQPEQVINWYYSNEAQLSQVQMSVLEEQVVEAILAEAAVTDVDSTYQDVISGRAIGAIDGGAPDVNAQQEA
jgi:trigger factor